MTIEKFCDTLEEIEKIDDKHKYAEAFCCLNIRNLLFIARNRRALQKRLKERFPDFDLVIE